MTQSLFVILNTVTVLVLVALALFTLSFRHHHPRQPKKLSNSSVLTSTTFNKAVALNLKIKNDLYSNPVTPQEKKVNRNRNFECDDDPNSNSNRIFQFQGQANSSNFKLVQRGKYLVIYNYVKPSTGRFNCDESITYAIHAHVQEISLDLDLDLNSRENLFINNLLIIAERWQGPISLTLFTPGTSKDIDEIIVPTIRHLLHYSLMKEYLFIHLLFGKKISNSNSIINKLETFHQDYNNININTKSVVEGNISEFKSNKNLPTRRILTGRKYSQERNFKNYSFNVARNIAREMAPTHYVLDVDDKLFYPSLNLIPRFLEMVRKRNGMKLERQNRKLFVLPVIEIESMKQSQNQSQNGTSKGILPADKAELRELLKKEFSASMGKEKLRFRGNGTDQCGDYNNRFPMQEEWLNTKRSENKTHGLNSNVFQVVKINGEKMCKDWQPVYIGTKLDPFVNEKLTFDERIDRIIQNYIFCVKDYELHILENAFLISVVPAPKTKAKGELSQEQNSTRTSRFNISKYKLTQVILPQVYRMYGKSPECEIKYM